MKAAQLPSNVIDGIDAARQKSAMAYLTLIIVVGCAFGAYFVVRYVGLWSENDTAVFATVIRGMQDAGRIDYPGAYVHGYAYPLWTTTLSHATTISVPDLLQIYLPLLGNALLGAFGFAIFRQVLSSDRLGLLAAAILFLVPELVFTVSRGNHEKLTVALTLLALMALLKGFIEVYRGSHWRLYAAWVVIFYATGFTLITLNVFFGSGFIVASSLSLVFVYMSAYGRPKARPTLRPIVRRLVLVVGTTWLLVALVMWYVYPRAGDNFMLLATASERLTALLLSATPNAPEGTPLPFAVSDPYSVGTTDWISLNAYGAVSSFRWILFISSFGIWVYLLVRVLSKLERVPIPRLFLVALYGAFGLQLAASIPLDFLGLSAGSNLQVRMYTYFALLAPPVFALGIASIVSRVQLPAFRSVIVVSLSIALSTFAVLSLAKATLDPSLSNRWLFYHPAEVQAIAFWDANHSNGTMWSDPEGRLRYAYALTNPGGTKSGNLLLAARRGEGTAHALHSETTRHSAAAWRSVPPSTWLHNRVYDGGEAQIFHRIARTPFQR